VATWRSGFGSSKSATLPRPDSRPQTALVHPSVNGEKRRHPHADARLTSEATTLNDQCSTTAEHRKPRAPNRCRLPSWQRNEQLPRRWGDAVRDIRLVKWAKEVSRTPLLQTTTKVLLLGLYVDGIDADWKISIPRAVMADRMGVSTRQVNTRIADAVRAGFLRQEIHGWKGTTAVYMVSAPKGDAVPRPRRARSDRAPWRQSGDAKAGSFQAPFESESRKRGGGALPVDNTACLAKAGSAGVLPVVRQATTEPAHPNEVPNLTPTDTGTSAKLSANNAPATFTPTATDAANLAVKDVGYGLGLKTSVGADFGADTAGGIGRGSGLCSALGSGLGQSLLQREGHSKTQAKSDLLTVDLEGDRLSGEAWASASLDAVVGSAG